MNRKKGFTLIELLVVIAIIALLLAVLIPSLKAAKDIAKRVMCATRLKQTGTGMKLYSDSYEYLPDAYDKYNDQTDDHAYAVYRDTFISPNGKLIPLRWAKLYEAGFIDVPEIFYCPGNRLDGYKYESYTDPTAWGTLPQQYNIADKYGDSHNQWVRIGYTYYPIARKPVIDSTTNAPSNPPKKFIELNQSLPYATDVLHGRENVSHQRQQSTDEAFHASNNYSVNALYADAHVSNCKDPEVFKNNVWDRFNASTVGYDEYYYVVFQLIGNR